MGLFLQKSPRTSLTDLQRGRSSEQSFLHLNFLGFLMFLLLFHDIIVEFFFFFFIVLPVFKYLGI